MRSHAEMRAQMAAAPAAAPPKPAVVKSRPMRDDEPIVVLPDNQ